MRIAAIARAAAGRRHLPRIVREGILQQIRIERIKQAQDEESWIFNLKIYLDGDISTFASADANHVP